MVNITIDPLPKLTWTGDPGEAHYTDTVLALTAAAGTDWIIDSLDGSRQDSATGLVFDAPAEFVLSARVTVARPRTTFDAGSLCLWASRDYWAKLCFEFSPQGQPGIVSVVTNGTSDDGNSFLVDADAVYLRISRVGTGWVFHASLDGVWWSFIRQFQLHTDLPIRAGFLAQSPMGETREVLFDSLTFDIVHLDASSFASDSSSTLRDGS